MAPAANSDSSSDDDADLSPEALERRQRAIQLLAKALHKGPADDSADTSVAPSPSPATASADEEIKFLQSLLNTQPKEMARTVRDRLSVLAVTKGGAQVSATKKPASGCTTHSTEREEEKVPESAATAGAASSAQ